MHIYAYSGHRDYVLYIRVAMCSTIMYRKNFIPAVEYWLYILVSPNFVYNPSSLLYKMVWVSFNLPCSFTLCGFVYLYAVSGIHKLSRRNVERRERTERIEK